MSKSPVHITKLTGKLEGFRSISVDTTSNEYCIKMNKTSAICGSCYSMKMLKGFRKNAQPALERNSKLLSERVIWNYELPTIKDKYFRFDAHGELHNIIHLINYVNIVEHNPDTNFSLWTKRKDLIRRYAKECGPFPKNLRLIYSNPVIDKVIPDVPEYFHQTFNNVTDKYDGVQQCTGQKCKDCLLCYGPKVTEQTIVEKVK